MLIALNVIVDLSSILNSPEVGIEPYSQLANELKMARQEIIKKCCIPVGTVPVYQAACMVDDVVELDENDFIKGIRKHIEDGVDFITIHAGLLRSSIPFIKKRLWIRG
jgi:thiamine biosynthesis protein ThiC